MKKTLVIAALFAFNTFAASWSGVISDSKCGAKHADASEKSMNCAQGCVKGGAAPVLVSDGKVYKIANADKVKEHVGHKVTVTGDMSGDTITVDTVSMD